MSKVPSKTKAKTKPKKPMRVDVELAPDAMERFERAIGVMTPARRKKVAKNK